MYHVALDQVTFFKVVVPTASFSGALVVAGNKRITGNGAAVGVVVMVKVVVGIVVVVVVVRIDRDVVGFDIVAATGRTVVLGATFALVVTRRFRVVARVVSPITGGCHQVTIALRELPPMVVGVGFVVSFVVVTGRITTTGGISVSSSVVIVGACAVVLVTEGATVVNSIRGRNIGSIVVAAVAVITSTSSLVAPVDDWVTIGSAVVAPLLTTTMGTKGG